MAKTIERKPRKRPKQARSQATFDSVLEAAARVLVEQGYECATTNRIAEVAGVGIGSLYEFFPNKDAIFTEVRTQLNEKMLAVVENAMEQALDLPLRDAIRGAVETLVLAHSVNPALEKALNERVPERVMAAQNRRIEKRLYGLAAAFFTRHAKNIRPKNFELAIFIVVQSSETLTLEASKRFPNELRNGKVLDEVSDLILRYIER